MHLHEADEMFEVCALVSHKRLSDNTLLHEPHALTVTAWVCQLKTVVCS